MQRTGNGGGWRKEHDIQDAGGGRKKKMQCGRGQGRSDLAEQGNICALVLAGFSLNVCYVSIGCNY